MNIFKTIKSSCKIFDGHRDCIPRLIRQLYAYCRPCMNYWRAVILNKMSYAIIYRMGGILLTKVNELLLKYNKFAMT